VSDGPLMLLGLATTFRRSSMTAVSRKLVPDERGRVTLGALAKGVSSYFVTELDDGALVLRPNVEIPRSALWTESFQAAELSPQAIAAVEHLIDNAPAPTDRLREAMKKHRGPR